MSTAAAEHVDSHDGGHEHPSDAKYIQIAAILAFVTALEVGTYFVDMPGIALGLQNDNRNIVSSATLVGHTDQPVHNSSHTTLGYFV